MTKQIENYTKKYNYVYQITNLINDKIYVGVRSCDCEPINDKYMGSGVSLKKAIKKYGINNFKKEILELCNSRKEANDLEKILVDIEFVNNKNTYNQCIGGWGKLLVTQETRDKIGIAHKNLLHSEETKEKISKLRQEEIDRFYHSDNLNYKTSGHQLRSGINTRKQPKNKELTQLKQSLIKQGTKLSEAHKQAISKSLKGVPKSQEHKNKMKGRIVSDDVRKRISEGNKKTKAENPYYYTDEQKKHKSKIMMGRKIKWKDKISDGLKEHYKNNTHPKKGKGKHIICTETNIKFTTIGDAANYLGIKYDRMASWLHNKSPNKSSLKFMNKIK